MSPNTQLNLLTPSPVPFSPQQPFELRDYQKRCISEILQSWRLGCRAPLLYAPTGAGKTAMASRIMDAATRKGHKVLFIVHRDPLVDQTAKALQIYGIQVGYCKAGYEPTDGTHSVIIASIQTLARRTFPEGIGLIIVDEAHTTAFHETYERLKAFYSGGVLKTSPVRFLGLTGSPWRVKSQMEFMGQHFDSIVRAPLPSELIEMGYLVYPRHFGWRGLADWNKLDTDASGEFNQKQASAITLGEQFNETVVQKCVQVAGARTAICFAQSVEQSRLLMRMFNAAGMSCEHLEADTPHSDRRQMYRRLASGETRILTSVGTLTEGFDVPSIGAVILARPTKSLSLLIQMCGRGLRLAPDKSDCLLLDFCENFKRLGRVDKKHKISLCPQFKGRDANTKECPKCHAEIYKFIMVCPECGYEFPSFPEDGEEEKLENFIPQFGELLSEEDKEKVRYLRSQLKGGFKKSLNPDRIWPLFRKKYGHFPPNDWHLGAVFRGDSSEFYRNEYREFLYKINPNPTEAWIRFHMELEFGKPGQTYKTAGGKTFTSPPCSTQRLEWWQVLDIEPLTDWEEVKIAYQQLIRRWHPDNPGMDEETAIAQIQLLNWAIGQGKEARKA